VAVAVVTDLPEMDHASRRDRLRDGLAALEVEMLLVTHAPDVRYLSGFAGSNGALLIGQDAERDLLVTDARYRERVADLDIGRVETQQRLIGVLGGLGRVRLGVDPERTSLGFAARLATEARDLSVEHAPDAITGLRQHKDAAEVARLSAACAITARSLAWVVEHHVRPGLSERAIARALEQRFLEEGADGVAFPTIVAGGISGASPHHATGERLLEHGELVTIDCGASIDGYCADMTRTVATGPVSGLLAEIHAVTVAANEAGRASATPGASVSGVDEAARAVVTEAGFGEAFVHPTGHGIGLDVHEAPLVTSGSTASLTVGTTFTVEPGIYLSGIGGVRIEDALVVAADGCVVMTVMERRLVGA